MPDPSPSPLTPEELRELERLEREATRAPWFSSSRDYDCARIWSEHGASDGVNSAQSEMSAMLMWPVHRNEPAAEAAAVEVTFANADLIAALRNAAPRLFSELLALREENERVWSYARHRDDCESYQAIHNDDGELQSGPCSCGFTGLGQRRAQEAREG